MSSFEKQRNRPYRSLLAALVLLAVTLAMGSTAIAQTPQLQGPYSSPGEP